VVVGLRGQMVPGLCWR